MVKFILFYFVSVLAPFSLAASADSELTIFTHYEFARLGTDKQIEYIKALREVAENIEERQLKGGMTYETALFKNSVWNMLLETIDAQTVAEEGATCLFAGGFSTYKKTGPKLTCANNRPCKGSKSKILCEEILHGENVCVPAQEHATKKCNQTSKISLEELAQQIAETNRSGWDDYKAKLESFCNPILAKGKKDLNLEACKEAKERFDLLHAKLKAIPEKKKPVAADAASTTTLRISTANVDCGQSGNPARFGCFTCPPVQFDKFEKKAKVSSSVANSKYSQLIEIMSKACGVSNTDSASDGVGAKTKEDLLKAFGNCAEADFPGYNKFSSKDAETKVKKLLSGDGNAISELAGKRYYNEYSLAMQEYFGLEIKEARFVFCRDGKKEESLQFLKEKWPEFYLKEGEGNQQSVANLIRKSDFLNSEAPLTQMPDYMIGNFNDNPVGTLNKFKAAAIKRRQLAKCLEKGGTGASAASRPSFNLERRPYLCTKRFVNVEYKDVATAVHQFKDADRICVDGGGKSTACLYDATGGFLRCENKPDEVESTVSAYSCKSTAQNPIRPGESLVAPAEGAD